LFSMKLVWFLQGLWKHWFSKGGAPMKQELTPEQVMEMGKMWGDVYLSTLSPEDFVKAAGTENIVKTVGTENIVKVIGLLKGMSVKEIEAYLRKRKKKK